MKKEPITERIKWLNTTDRIDFNHHLSECFRLRVAQHGRRKPMEGLTKDAEAWLDTNDKRTAPKLKEAEKKQLATYTPKTTP